MPRGDDHTRVQSNLQFQPLLSLRLTEKQGLIIRPIVTIVNSVPHFDQSGQNERTAGFGDTVLAFALPRSLLGGRLMVGAGPTFIFPTASEDLLSQDTWQVGPDAGAVLLGKHFIAYGFVQQWFKIGGDGRDTNQMSGTFNFTYLFAKRVDHRDAAEPFGRLGGARRRARDVWDRATGGQDVQMRRPADAVPAAGSGTTRFVQASPVRSGIFSCKRRRRFRPSSRKRSSDQGKLHAVGALAQVDGEALIPRPVLHAVIGAAPAGAVQVTPVERVGRSARRAAGQNAVTFVLHQPGDSVEAARLSTRHRSTRSGDRFGRARRFPRW